jgi:hypothetical protein
MSRASASAHFQTTLFLSAIPKRQVPSKGGKGTGHGREAPEDRADSQHGTYHVGQVHAHGHVAVAAVVLEPVVAQQQRDERDVRAVHRLQGEPVAGAVEVSVGDEVLDGLEHLLQEASLDETGLKHDSCVGVVNGRATCAFGYADGGKPRSVQVFRIASFFFEFLVSRLVS